MAAQLIGIKDFAARAPFLMNRPSDHFLAGAAFAHDEDINSQIANVSPSSKISRILAL
jgi:hypothetical protein